MASPMIITIQGTDRNTGEQLDAWVITEQGNMQGFISQYMYRFSGVDMSTLTIEISNPPSVKTVMENLATLVPNVTKAEREFSNNGDG